MDVQIKTPSLSVNQGVPAIKLASSKYKKESSSSSSSSSSSDSVEVSNPKQPINNSEGSSAIPGLKISARLEKGAEPENFWNFNSQEDSHSSSSYGDTASEGSVVVNNQQASGQNPPSVPDSKLKFDFNVPKPNLAQKQNNPIANISSGFNEKKQIKFSENSFSSISDEENSSFTKGKGVEIRGKVPNIHLDTNESEQSEESKLMNKEENQYVLSLGKESANPPRKIGFSGQGMAGASVNPQRISPPKPRGFEQVDDLDVIILQENPKNVGQQKIEESKWKNTPTFQPQGNGEIKQDLNVQKIEIKGEGPKIGGGFGFGGKASESQEKGKNVEIKAEGPKIGGGFGFGGKGKNIEIKGEAPKISGGLGLGGRLSESSDKGKNIEVPKMSGGLGFGGRANESSDKGKNIEIKGEVPNISGGLGFGGKGSESSDKGKNIEVPKMSGGLGFGGRANESSDKGKNIEIKGEIPNISGGLGFGGKGSESSDKGKNIEIKGEVPKISGGLGFGGRASENPDKGKNIEIKGEAPKISRSFGLGERTNESSEKGKIIEIGEPDAKLKFQDPKMQFGFKGDDKGPKLGEFKMKGEPNIKENEDKFKAGLGMQKGQILVQDVDEVDMDVDIGRPQPMAKIQGNLQAPELNAASKDKNIELKGPKPYNEGSADIKIQKSAKEPDFGINLPGKSSAGGNFESPSIPNFGVDAKIEAKNLDLNKPKLVADENIDKKGTGLQINSEGIKLPQPNLGDKKAEKGNLNFGFQGNMQGLDAGLKGNKPKGNLLQDTEIKGNIDNKQSKLKFEPKLTDNIEIDKPKFKSGLKIGLSGEEDAKLAQPAPEPKLDVQKSKESVDLKGKLQPEENLKLKGNLPNPKIPQEEIKIGAQYSSVQTISPSQPGNELKYSTNPPTYQAKIDPKLNIEKSDPKSFDKNLKLPTQKLNEEIPSVGLPKGKLEINTDMKIQGGKSEEKAPAKKDIDIAAKNALNPVDLEDDIEISIPKFNRNLQFNKGKQDPKAPETKIPQAKFGANIPDPKPAQKQDLGFQMEKPKAGFQGIISEPQLPQAKVIESKEIKIEGPKESFGFQGKISSQNIEIDDKNVEHKIPSLRKETGNIDLAPKTNLPEAGLGMKEPAKKGFEIPNVESKGIAKSDIKINEPSIKVSQMKSGQGNLDINLKGPGYEKQPEIGSSQAKFGNADINKPQFGNEKAGKQGNFGFRGGAGINIDMGGKIVESPDSKQDSFSSIDSKPSVKENEAGFNFEFDESKKKPNVPPLNIPKTGNFEMKFDQKPAPGPAAKETGLKIEKGEIKIPEINEPPIKPKIETKANIPSIKGFSNQEFKASGPEVQGKSQFDPKINAPGMSSDFKASGGLEIKTASNLPPKPKASDKYNLSYDSSSDSDSSASRKSLEHSIKVDIKDQEKIIKPVTQFKPSTNIIQTEEVVKKVPEKKFEFSTPNFDEESVDIKYDASAKLPAKKIEVNLEASQPDIPKPQMKKADPSPAVEIPKVSSAITVAQQLKQPSKIEVIRTNPDSSAGLSNGRDTLEAQMRMPQPKIINDKLQASAVVDNNWQANKNDSPQKIDHEEIKFEEQKIINRGPQVQMSDTNANLNRDGSLRGPRVLEFEDTLRIFKNLTIPSDVMPTKTLYKKQDCFLSLFKCFGKEQDELSEELEATCFKLYKFSKLPYDKDEMFHQSCLLSVYFCITTETEWPSNDSAWERIGIKNINTDLSWNGACYGLISVLFMSTFYSNKFKEMLQASRRPDTLFPFLEVLMRLSKIPIKILRTRKLNSFIKGNNNKALEVIFFFYAGVLLFWFGLFTNYHMTMEDFGIMYEKTYKRAKASPKDLILQAKEVYSQQSRR